MTSQELRSSTDDSQAVAFAHTLEGRGQESWERLDDHLAAVALLAAEFAGVLGATEWGRLLGRWHDLGKLSKEFQDYIRVAGDPDAGEEVTTSRRVDHSTFGAQFALRALGAEKHSAWILAYCIAGHHAGLPDGSATEESRARSSLKARLKAGPPRVPLVTSEPPMGDLPHLHLPFAVHPQDVGFQVAFFTRMLFSCLVDADRLATEAFCDREASGARAKPKATLDHLKRVFDNHMTIVERDAPRHEVNRVRSEVLAHCRIASELTPGFFSLNVPTGGGKTLASLGFALRHATRHGLRRVIVAIPFTSIVEQTVDAYRTALADSEESPAVIEHHSNVVPSQTRQSHMAAENWDAPVVVTTNVQLFESLFASGTSQCRKLHRLAGSVIILDEAQTIPIPLLRPTLSALRELVEHYGCSVVLCTATQPALQRREDFSIGIDGVREIVPDVQSLYQRLKRVQIVRVRDALTDDQLAERLLKEPQVLCIVNTRPDASRLYDALSSRAKTGECFHLSAFMCAEHRRRLLEVVKTRVRAALPCRVVSTQLIEAGVDIDFPVVYRAPAGFDSIAQAAGRCNREGRLDSGQIYLLEHGSLPPAGLLRQAAQVARELFSLHDDPLEPEAVEAYFRQLYWTQEHVWDKHAVLEQFADDLRRPELLLQFREASARYEVIRDEQASVLVPYDNEAVRLRDQLLRGGVYDFRIMRTVQRFLVGVWPNTLRELLSRGLVVQHDSGIFLLTSESAYTDTKGLTISGSGFDPELLVQ